MKLMTIWHQILKEDALKNYMLYLPKFDPTYITNQDKTVYAKMQGISTLLTKSYSEMSPEAKRQSALVFKQEFLKKNPENVKMKRWDPNDDVALGAFDGIAVKGVTDVVV